LIRIYYCLLEAIPPHTIAQWRETLPVSIQQRIDTYQIEDDRNSRIAAWYMLQLLIDAFGLTDSVSLAQVQRGRNNKPYLTDSLYFSIAHCKGIAICVVSTVYEIGIDVEIYPHADVDAVKSVCTESEWDNLITCLYPSNGIVDIWTIKEAIAKASGEGVHADWLTIETNTDKDTIYYKSQPYTIQTLGLPEPYLGCVAVKADISMNLRCEEIKC
jgi:phosphopantetheinyl transferase